MSKRLIDDLLAVLDQGYAPYTGAVDGKVYARHSCPRPDKSAWFTRRGRFICLGCARRCSQAHAKGFQAVLPGMRWGVKVAYACLPAITAEELLRAKPLLRAEEAAYVLNISRSQVYQLIATGRLDRHEDDPVRVTSASVREELERLAE